MNALRNHEGGITLSPAERTVLIQDVRIASNLAAECIEWLDEIIRSMMRIPNMPESAATLAAMAQHMASDRVDLVRDFTAETVAKLEKM